MLPQYRRSRRGIAAAAFCGPRFTANRDKHVRTGERPMRTLVLSVIAAMSASALAPAYAADVFPPAAYGAAPPPAYQPPPPRYVQAPPPPPAYGPPPAVA